MAPMTRSSMPGRSQSDTQMPSIRDSVEGALEDEFYSDQEDEEHTQTSLQDFLQPLQETADRVTQQVEDFARKLHKFKSERTPEDQELWDNAFILLDDFKDISKTRANKTPGRSLRGLKRRSDGDTEAEHEKVILETDLWELLKRLLLCKSPKSADNAKNAQKEKLFKLHRYSTSVDLWDSFLDSDLSGQEYESTLDWLQERQEKTEKPIEDVIRSWTERSERGDGVWSAGPMFTKNTIKHKKRTRGLNTPLESGTLGNTSITNDNAAGLVSQLDPDAATRQRAKLEPQDGSHEEGAWLTLWELLRRGSNVEEVRSWWAERNEQWRSLVLRVCNAHPGEDRNSPWYRMMNIANNSQWISVCRSLAQTDAALTDVQRAVLGILCGDAEASFPVCGTTDEHLFSSFNALLIERYQNYLLQYHQKLTDDTQSHYKPPPSEPARVSQSCRAAVNDPNLKFVGDLSYRRVQMVIISSEYETFLRMTGRVAADWAYSTDDVFRYLMAPNEGGEGSSDSAMILASDHDSVRFVAHLQILVRALGLLPSYNRFQYVLENNIANYIGWLQKHRQWDLIPLYASNLSKDRVQKVLGTILIDVTDDRERSTQVKLLKRYKINVADVVYGIFALANYDQRVRFESPSFKLSAPRITELKGTGKTANLAIVTDFMMDDPTPEDDKLVSSVEWYRYIDPQNWGKACFSIAFLYKLWLCEGNFAAVRLLTERVNLGEMSLHALGMNLNFAEDTDEAEADVQANGDSEDGQRKPASPSKGRKNQQPHPLSRQVSSRRALYEQSLTWMHLEQLVVALDTLNAFQEFADEFDSLPKDDIAKVKGYKASLKKAFEATQDAIIPILEPEFLCSPSDEKEAVHLTWIRNHYLTECVLGYNSVLYFAGHAITRGHLKECMDLAQIVAGNGSLTQAFVESGKMRELVRAFALDSQALLLANEQGKKSSSKREKGLDIWQVQWKDGQEVDLDALD